MAIHRDGPGQLWWILAQRGEVLSPQQALLVNALLGHERAVSYEELCNVVYGDDSDGGPLDIKRAVRLLIMRLRRHITIARLPWRIESIRNFGYRLRYLQ